MIIGRSTLPVVIGDCLFDYAPWKKPEPSRREFLKVAPSKNPVQAL